MVVSVVIETYNGAKYIREQIESILRQTRLPDQILIRDDGSTDDTVSIIKGYVNRNPRLVKLLVDGQRLGCDSGFIECFKHADGEIIFACDQDDIWMEEKIETMLSLFDAHTDLVYAQDLELFEESGETRLSVVSIPPLDKSVYYCYLKGHTSAFRKSILPIFDFKGLITWDYYLQLYAIVSGRYKECPQALMYWRRHSNSQTVSSSLSSDCQIGKWELCAESVKKVRSGFFSDCIKNRFADRSAYLAYLLRERYVDASQRKEVSRSIKILSLISQQTCFTLLCASFLNAVSAAVRKPSGRASLRFCIAKILYEFRYPLTYYYKESDKKYL